MEVREAPNKIYVHVKKNTVTNTWNSTWIGVHDIEYIRKDAFIKKVEMWLKEIHRVCDITDEHGYRIELWKLEKSFENFMKGE